jgi:hypothetical protein
MPALGACLSLGERLAFDLVSDFWEAAEQELSSLGRLSCGVEDRFAGPDP